MHSLLVSFLFSSPILLEEAQLQLGEGTRLVNPAPPLKPLVDYSTLLRPAKVDHLSHFSDTFFWILRRGCQCLIKINEVRDFN